MTIFSLHTIRILWWFFWYVLIWWHDIELKNKAWSKVNNKKHELWEHDLPSRSHCFSLLSLIWKTLLVSRTYHQMCDMVLTGLVVLLFICSAAELKLLPNLCDTCKRIPIEVRDQSTVFLDCVDSLSYYFAYLKWFIKVWKNNRPVFVNF